MSHTLCLQLIEGGGFNDQKSSKLLHGISLLLPLCPRIVLLLLFLFFMTFSTGAYRGTWRYLCFLFFLFVYWRLNGINVTQTATSVFYIYMYSVTILMTPSQNISWRVFMIVCMLVYLQVQGCVPNAGYLGCIVSTMLTCCLALTHCAG